MKKRIISLLLVCVFGCLILSACGKKEESALELKDEFAFSVPGEIEGQLNPFFAKTEGDLQVLSVMTERYLSSKGVASCEAVVDADGFLTVIVTVKEGIFCFQDSELSAVDFQYAVQFVCDPSYDGPLTGLSKSSIVGLKEFQSAQTTELSGVERVDKYTCKVTFSDQNEDYLTLLDLPTVHSANYGGYSYGKCAYEDMNAKYAKVISTGPYQVERLLPSDGKLWNLIPNDNYHLGKPQMRDVTVRHVADAEVGLNMQLGQLTAGFLYDQKTAEEQAIRYGFVAIHLQDGALLCRKDADFISDISENMTICRALVAIMTEN